METPESMLNVHVRAVCRKINVRATAKTAVQTAKSDEHTTRV